MSFTTEAEKYASAKHVLIELEPGIPLTGWTLTAAQTYTYEHAFVNFVQMGITPGGLYRLVIGVEADGTALTEQTSIANVEANEGSWWHDTSAEKLYVHVVGGVDPDTLSLVMPLFRIHFSNDGITLNDGTNDINFEKRLAEGTTTAIKEEAADFTAGLQMTTTAGIQLANHDGLFDILSKSWIWRDRVARARFGINDLAYGDYVTLMETRIEDANLPVPTIFSIDLFSSLDRWRDEFPPNKFSNPQAGSGVLGSIKPVIYGQHVNVPGFLTSNVEGAWVEKFADEDVQTLFEIYGIVAIGSIETEELVDGVDTTNDLNGCGTIISNLRYDPSDPWTIKANLAGKPDGVGSYLKYPGEIAKDVLKTFLGYEDADLVLASFDNVDAICPFELAIYESSKMTVREVLRGIERSVIGRIRQTPTGLIEFTIWDPGFDSSSAIEIDYADMSSHLAFDLRHRAIFYQVALEYALEPTGYSRLAISTDEATRLKYGLTGQLEVQTYLRHSQHAQLIADRLLFIYKNVRTEASFSEARARLMEHSVYSRVSMTATRAPEASTGSYTGRLMEIVNIGKDLVRPKTRCTVLDIEEFGLVDKIGTWANPAGDAPTGYWDTADDSRWW